MNVTQDLEDIFAIFHDGYIDAYSIEYDQIELKIGIPYLAELINETHEYIQLSLVGVDFIKFVPWNDEPLIIIDGNEIFNFNLDILDSKVDDSENIIVHVNCENAPNNAFSGGELIFKCSSYILRNEDGDLLSVDKLKELSTKYWNQYSD